MKKNESSDAVKPIPKATKPDTPPAIAVIPSTPAPPDTPPAECKEPSASHNKKEGKSSTNVPEQTPKPKEDTHKTQEEKKERGEEKKSKAKGKVKGKG